MGQDQKPVTRGWGGALAVAGGFLVGFLVWGIGAAPGLRGAFEGERDLSLLYAELPLTLFGMPALALGAWALAVGVLRVREGMAVLVVVGALALGAWGCAEWLDLRTTSFTSDAPL
ncbi:hypothetical protein ACIOJD_03395 [Streptomyces sp. NPDC088116]|uniref:hypothetical protein n=1 Tax=Streptomyces sp. NPDC088116 TaxID=3365825 RepID=UPI003807CEE7